MSRPTRRDKAIAFGAPALLGVAFAVRMLARGTVSSAGLWVYLAVAVALAVWAWRRSGL